MSADVALAHMERAVAEYGRINQRLHKALHASRAHTAELVAARTGVKASFIAHKTQFRRAVTALTSVSAAARATARLTELQAAYRACNQEFCALLQDARHEQDTQHRAELLLGVADTDLDAGPVPRSNDELLASSKAAAVQTQDIEAALHLGTAAAEVLARDAQQLQSVSSALDGVQSELQLARKLLLRVIKSLYTDKIFLLFVFLVAAVLTCIVVYAGVNKWQL